MRDRSATSTSIDLRIDHRSALRDGPDRRHELLDILDALLQEVSAPGGAAFQKCERIARLGVLAEHDHADVRVCLAKPVGGLDPLVSSARGHADVGDHDVRGLGFDGREEGVEVGAHGPDLEIRLCLEQSSHTLADEIVVICEHQANRHGGEAYAVCLQSPGRRTPSM